MVAGRLGAIGDTNVEVNLPAGSHEPDRREPPQTGEVDSATPFAVHLEPMKDGWVRVRVEGELALDSSSTLERAVEAELMADSHVLLDLSGIEFIDSAGLRAMTALVRIAKATGRKLRLSTDLPAHTRRLMEIVGLLPFVPIGIDDPWSDSSGSLPDAPSA
ncbi:MAG: STAS domain-containing protein [Solirubrobacteraceae bacterium]